MGVKIDIVIPSMGRAERVSTFKAIANCKICVPESQEDDYREHYPDVEVITHPDTLKGLTLKRQFIHEKFPNVLMVDDDVKSVQKMYTEQGEEYKCDKEEAYEIIQYVGNIAKLAGCYLFGFSHSPMPSAYNPLKPINMTGVVNGDIGILEGSKLYFHELAKVSEDYWISAYNAYVHRYCWIDNRYYVACKDTFGNVGGCSSLRSKEQEAEDTMFLRKMFGEAIRLKQDTALAKRKHEYMRTLSIPY